MVPLLSMEYVMGHLINIFLLYLCFKETNQTNILFMQEEFNVFLFIWPV